MIYTVTLNPAVDKTLQVDSFALDAVNRASSCRQDPGGKGINVSKTVSALGGRSTAYAVLSGSTGAFIEGALERMGIVCKAFHGSGETRTNTKVVDPVLGTFTDINEPGSPVEDRLLDDMLDSLVREIGPGDIVTLSGSLPAGASADVYAAWARRCGATGAHVVLDADGDAFAHGVEAAPYLVKPNDAELGRFCGRKLEGDGDIVDAARELLEKGVEKVMVSLGGDGAILVARDAVWRARQPQVQAVSTVGAGDSVVAALAVAYQRGEGDEEAVRLAMATGAATVMRPGTEPARIEDVERLLPQTTVRRLDL